MKRVQISRILSIILCQVVLLTSLPGIPAHAGTVDNTVNMTVSGVQANEKETSAQLVTPTPAESSLSEPSSAAEPFSSSEPSAPENPTPTVTPTETEDSSEEPATTEEETTTEEPALGREGTLPASDENIDYILGRPMTEEEIAAQRALEPAVLPDLVEHPVETYTPSTSVYGFDRVVSYPAKYDSRDYNYISSVKNQNPWGTCWAFSSIAAAEANATKNSLSISTRDFSERHLTYYANHTGNTC